MINLRQGFDVMIALQQIGCFVSSTDKKTVYPFN
jgi:hypothetical protein